MLSLKCWECRWDSLKDTSESTGKVQEIPECYTSNSEFGNSTKCEGKNATCVKQKDGKKIILEICVSYSYNIHEFLLTQIALNDITFPLLEFNGTQGKLRYCGHLVLSVNSKEVDIDLPKILSTAVHCTKNNTWYCATNECNSAPHSFHRFGLSVIMVLELILSCSMALFMK